jgi:hypothetical protein
MWLSGQHWFNSNVKGHILRVSVPGHTMCRCGWVSSTVTCRSKDKGSIPPLVLFCQIMLCTLGGWVGRFKSSSECHFVKSFQCSQCHRPHLKSLNAKAQHVPTSCRSTDIGSISSLFWLFYWPLLSKRTLRNITYGTEVILAGRHLVMYLPLSIFYFRSLLHKKKEKTTKIMCQYLRKEL